MFTAAVVFPATVVVKRERLRRYTALRDLGLHSLTLKGELPPDVIEYLRKRAKLDLNRGDLESAGRWMNMTGGKHWRMNRSFEVTS